jgi:hypothetical protein
MIWEVANSRCGSWKVVGEALKRKGHQRIRRLAAVRDISGIFFCSYDENTVCAIPFGLRDQFYQLRKDPAS